MVMTNKDLVFKVCPLVTHFS